MEKARVMFSSVNMEVLINSSVSTCDVCQSGTGQFNLMLRMQTVCTKSAMEFVVNQYKMKILGATGAVVLSDLLQCAIAISSHWQENILDVVDTFWHLGDTVSTGGGCKHSAIV